MADYMLNKEYLEVANLPILWALVIPTVIVVLVQAYLFMKQSIAAGPNVGLTKDELRTAVRVGAISAIGPGLSMFAIMIALMSILGGPMAWLRLSIIGTITTEMLSSTAGADAMGVALGGPDYGVIAFANSVWVITLNTWGFFVFNLLFAHKFEKVKDAIGKRDINLFNFVGTCVMIGAIGMFTAGQMVAGKGTAIAALASAVCMFILIQIANKVPKLKEFNLGISMIVGMLVAQFIIG